MALDIFHLIFRCVKPTELMTPTNKVCVQTQGNQRLVLKTAMDVQIDENRLKDLLDLEGKKKKTAAKLSTSRHSRFGTTVALKAVSDELPTPYYSPGTDPIFRTAGQAAVHHAQTVNSPRRRGADNGQDQEEQSEEDPSGREPETFLSSFRPLADPPTYA